MLLNNLDNVRAGLKYSRMAQKSVWGQVKFGPSGLAIALPVIAFQAAHSQRGEMVPTLAGKGAALMMFPALAGFASAALCLIPGIGPAAAALLGPILAGYPDEVLGNSLARKVRLFTDSNKRIRHLEMGGNYNDTELAQRQRFIAVQDMNATMIPGRRYLGQEALLMHR